MNILLINHYAGSRGLGMEYRPYYLARQWAAQGHRLTIAAASFSHLRSAQIDCQRGVQEEYLDGLRYVWLRTPAYSDNGPGRARNMLSFLWRLYRHRRFVVGDAPPDAVIASSTYPLDLYPARRIARKHDAALIFELHDLWPLSPVELGGMPRWHPFILLVQRAEDFACRHADRVVSILPKADAHLVTRGMAPEKFSHVPNGLDVAEWTEAHAVLPREHAEAVGRERSKGRFLIGYCGTHGPANALHVLVEAAEELRGEPITLVLVGQGPDKARLEESIRRKSLQNVVLLPPLSKSSVPAFLAGMDALYVGWRPLSLYRFGISPNKVFDYMMAGRPVIHSVSAGNDMVAESGCGISVPAGDPRGVADAVRTMARMPAAERAAIGARGSQYVRTRHDYRVLAARFLKILEDAVAERRRAIPARRAA